MSRCARDNLRGQKSLGPLKMFIEIAHKVIVPQKKIMSQSFLNSGTLVILCTRVLLCTVVVCCCLLLGVLVCCCVLLCVRGSPCSCVVWAGIQGEGAGWQGSPSPSHYSVGIHGCLLVSGGCYSYIRFDPSLAVSWLAHPYYVQIP